MKLYSVHCTYMYCLNTEMHTFLIKETNDFFSTFSQKSNI